MRRAGLGGAVHGLIGFLSDSRLLAIAAMTIKRKTKRGSSIKVFSEPETRKASSAASAAAA
jgi:hypothetical protein